MILYNKLYKKYPELLKDTNFKNKGLGRPGYRIPLICDWCKLEFTMASCGYFTKANRHFCNRNCHTSFKKRGTRPYSINQSIVIDETLKLHGTHPNRIGPGSALKVCVKCHGCNKENVIRMMNLSRLDKKRYHCKSCAQTFGVKKLKLPKIINVKATISKFGYDPSKFNSIKLNKNKKVIANCNKCGENRVLRFDTTTMAKTGKSCQKCINIKSHEISLSEEFLNKPISFQEAEFLGWLYLNGSVHNDQPKFSTVSIGSFRERISTSKFKSEFIKLLRIMKYHYTVKKTGDFIFASKKYRARISYISGILDIKINNRKQLRIAILKTLMKSTLSIRLIFLNTILHKNWRGLRNYKYGWKSICLSLTGIYRSEKDLLKKILESLNIKYTESIHTVKTDPSWGGSYKKYAIHYSFHLTSGDFIFENHRINKNKDGYRWEITKL